MTDPRILIFDIESSPLTIRAWDTYDTSSLKVLEYSHLMSFAWKWLGEDEVHCMIQPDFARAYKRNRRDDRQLVEAAWKLLDEADVVVAHYGNKFDVPKMRAWFLKHGLFDPSFYAQVDTKVIASRNFKLADNRLNTIADFLGIGSKLPHTGYDLWENCMQGDMDAWKVMHDYNVHDVELLEQVYLKLLPYARNSQVPNLATISGRNDACPKCGKEAGFVSRGYKHTAVSSFQQWQCKACHGYSRTRLSVQQPMDRARRTN